MARPAGFSSDEDDIFDDYCSPNIQETIQPIYSENQLKSKKLNNLYICIVTGNLDDTLSIINDDLDVNVLLNDDWTPLMLAASTGQVQLVKKFIELGANVNADRDKYTVLMAACACPETCAPFTDSLKIAKILIKKGVDVNLQNRTRMTAFLFAAKAGNLELINFLLPICDKTAEDNQGWNALLWAVNENKPLIVHRLLEEGFSPNKLDIRNNSPLFYATNNNFEEIISMFPAKIEKDKYLYESNVYDLEEVFKNETRPTFFKDVTLLLHGMKCENLISKFKQHNMSLSNFLSLTDADLQKLDINAPFQRRRILMGLYRFHKHPYKKKSVPIVDKNKPYSTIDLSHTILTSVRQIVAMEAALLYLLENMSPNHELMCCKEIKSIKEKIGRLRGTCVRLKEFAKQCDAEKGAVDLITEKSRKFKYNRINWACGITLGSFALIMFYKLKYI